MRAWQRTPATAVWSPHTNSIVDDLRGVVLDVAVTTGEINEGQTIERIEAAMVSTGLSVSTVTAGAG